MHSVLVCELWLTSVLGLGLWGLGGSPLREGLSFSEMWKQVKVIPGSSKASLGGGRFSPALSQ